ncbi:hypothetical protein CcCBS67573_g00974 [Chytriomyces confervae]|uniref:Uncharacterized protein n=1 Tax=Chytriomyces confervae TaxID=246404 RepID=A0A507FN79_9FUNG|nr:hypothetical protein BJ741DRAFT_617952 [Chytriomyces cf. hyalinus JEL632]KAJ3408521.1 hypothetical protein HDU80_005475 [Chytriomyces hyalinus]TPX77722.1 hypothetical protein CcCBS67573_g00974 [Chytriomyces confervae]
MIGLRILQRANTARSIGFAARFQSTKTVGAFSSESIGALFPSTAGLSANSTLGEVYERLYTKYEYRLAYPIALWVGFLWYNLWIEEMPASEKKALKDRIEYLKTLEFHQK